MAPSASASAPGPASTLVPPPPPPRAPTPTPLLKAPAKPASSSEVAISSGGGKDKKGPTSAAPVDSQATTAGKAGAAAPAEDGPVKAQPQPPPPRRPPGGRNGLAAADPLSDKATAFLIRRVLCPQQQQQQAGGSGGSGSNGSVGGGGGVAAPIEELQLPPLTSRNDVDLQLYALIAIVLREFVQSWYGKITPDEDFVGEIVQVIAHCTRALEQRLRKVDLESLLFDELPALLDRHVDAYRTAYRPMVGPPLAVDPRQIYHSLCPFPALSPVPSRGKGGDGSDEGDEQQQQQALNESTYRQLLVQGVLAVLLPTEDLENPCLTALVGQIMSELIIGGVVARKLSEPWMVWEGLCILARVVRQKAQKTDPASSTSLSSSANLSPSNKAAVTAESTTSRASATSGSGHSGRSAHGLSLQRLFWSALQTGFLLFGLLRMAVLTLATYRSVPSRLANGVGGGASSHGRRTGLSKASLAHEGGVGISTQPVKTPVLAFRIWPTLSNLIEMDCRMPWLGGSLSLLQWMAMMGPGRLAGLDGPVDRIISHAIARHVLDPMQLPPLLRALRGALFPNNAMGTPSLFPPSSEQELLALRRRCASSLWDLVPSGVGALYFGAATTTWKRKSRSSSSSTTTSTMKKWRGKGMMKSGGLGAVADGGQTQQPQLQQLHQLHQKLDQKQDQKQQQHFKPLSTMSISSTSLRTGPSSGVDFSPPQPQRAGGRGGGGSISASASSSISRTHSPTSARDRTAQKRKPGQNEVVVDQQQQQQQQPQQLSSQDASAHQTAAVAGASKSDKTNKGCERDEDGDQMGGAIDASGGTAVRGGVQVQVQVPSCGAATATRPGPGAGARLHHHAEGVFHPDVVDDMDEGGKDDDHDPHIDSDSDSDRERIISEIEEGILDVFSDVYCNKHLMYGVLELVLERLIPELAERGVVELWHERLS